MFCDRDSEPEIYNKRVRRSWSKRLGGTLDDLGTAVAVETAKNAT